MVRRLQFGGSMYEHEADVDYDAQGDEWNQVGASSTPELIGQQIGKYTPLALAATNVATQAAFYKNLRDKKLKAKVRPYEEVSFSVRPVQGIPEEVSSNFMNRLGQVQSTYAGSDPSMSLVSKSIAGAQKQQALDDFTSKEAETVMQDRARYDKQMRENEQLRAGVRKENLDRRQQQDEYRQAAELDYTKEMQQLTGTTLDQASQSIYNENLYNAQANQVEQETALRHKSWKISVLTQQLENLTVGDTQYNTIQAEIDKLYTEIDDLIKTPAPTTGNIRGGLFSGNILVPKPEFNKITGESEE